MDIKQSWGVLVFEETFQQGKGQVGLDHYQCRHWQAWYRFATMAMLALAILTAIAVASTPPHADLIALTVPEIRRLINTFILTQPTRPIQALHWSMWRRRHQARARTSHHRRRHQLELNR